MPTTERFKVGSNQVKIFVVSSFKFLSILLKFGKMLETGYDIDPLPVAAYACVDIGGS